MRTGSVSSGARGFFFGSTSSSGKAHLTCEVTMGGAGGMD